MIDSLCRRRRARPSSVFETGWVRSSLADFLAFWEKSLDGPLFAVTVAHSKLIKPAELRAVDGVYRLH